MARATEFFQIWDELVQMTLGRSGLQVVAPLLELELWQVVDLGVQVNAPLDRTWSCVDDHADPCNACRGCRSRDAAFMQAAKPDPAQADAGEVGPLPRYTPAMQRSVGLDGLRSLPPGSVLSVGNYDGVHTGHAAILRAMRDAADAAGAVTAVVTFEPHPAHRFCGPTSPRRG